METPKKSCKNPAKTKKPGPSKRKFSKKKIFKGNFFLKVVHLTPKRRQKKVFFLKKKFPQFFYDKMTLIPGRILG